MFTIAEMKDRFEALIGKTVRLTLTCLPKLSYEGVLKRYERAGFPYIIELIGGGRLLPYEKLRVSELREVA